jgi:hypothetical protein
VTPLPKAPGAQFGTYRDRKTFAIEAAKHFANAPALVHVPDVTNSLALEHSSSLLLWLRLSRNRMPMLTALADGADNGRKRHSSSRLARRDR